MFSLRLLPTFIAMLSFLGSIPASPVAAQVQALPPNTVGPTALPDYPPIPARGDSQPLQEPNIAATPVQPAPPRGQYEHVGLGSLGRETPLVAYRSSSVYRPDYACWQILPDGLLYKSYLAGNREPRFASLWVHEKDQGWLWDSVLGGRVGILRYGTTDPINPQGWQIDVEGAAFPRLDMEHGRDLVSADFRIGVPLTHRQGRWQSKFGYYHLSSHLGDEYMVRNNTLNRINYVRDCLILGVGFFPNPDVRLYAEADWAFVPDGGARPWEFQFGMEYSPAQPTGFWGTPFFAVNGHIREANGYGGNFTAQTGWQWRGQSGHLVRMGVQYFNGMSDQGQFFNQYEEQIGMAIWYDY